MLKRVNQDPTNLHISASVFGPYTITTPISGIASISTGNVLVAVGVPQTMVLNNDGVGNMAIGLPIGGATIIGGYMQYPIIPVFTSSVAGNMFSFVLTGYNQYGERIVETGTKVTSSVATYFDLSAYSRIDSCVVTPLVVATPGTDTLAMGWDLRATTGQNRFALPFKVRESADMPLNVYPTSIGGGTLSSLTVGTSKAINIGGLGGFVAPNAALTRNTNFEKGVISLAVGMTGQPTASMTMQVWLKPESLVTY